MWVPRRITRISLSDLPRCGATQYRNSETIRWPTPGERNVRATRHRWFAQVDGDDGGGGSRKPITGEITTGRVIARLNSTITGLIWPLLARPPLHYTTMRCRCFTRRARRGESGRAGRAGAGISRQIAFRDIERVLFDWTSRELRACDSICRIYATRIYLRASVCLPTRLYVRGWLRLDLITRSSVCCVYTHRADMSAS